MVYAAAIALAADEAAVARMSFADSKALTETIREALFTDILAHPRLAHRVESLSAPAISAAMLGRARISLNALASDATVALVRGALDAGANVAHVYVDTVGDAGRWADALRSKVKGWWCGGGWRLKVCFLRRQNNPPLSSLSHSVPRHQVHR